MEPTVEECWWRALSDVLNRSHLFQPDGLAAAVDTALGRLGIRCAIYLVDEEQEALWPVAAPGVPVQERQPVESSLPGRVFSQVKSLPDQGGWWVPMVNGTDRLGVINFVVTDDALPAVVRDAELPARCETVAGLVGHLVTVTAPKGDFLAQVRRTRPMSTAAELLRQMLPPFTAACDRMSLSAILEPWYDVGGDGFDYAIDGSRARLVILDAVGHGLRAATACTIAIAAIRSSRRAGLGLVEQAQAADAALAEQFGDSRFVTAVLAELDLDAGKLRYINAGHPRPLLLRAGHVVRELAEGRRVPLGLDAPSAQLAEESLQPEDRVLLYTDGVTEARNRDDEAFGVNRLIDLTERHAAARLPAAETLRRLARAVATHRDGPPDDDATLLLAEWSPDAARRNVP